MAQAGGSTPAARRPCARSGARSRRACRRSAKRAGASPRLAKACATPPGTKASSPARFVTSSSSTWKVELTLQHVEHLVEGVVVQRRPGRAGGHAVVSITPTRPSFCSPCTTTLNWSPAGAIGVAAATSSRSPICPPTVVTGGVGASAHAGGSSPAASRRQAGEVALEAGRRAQQQVARRRVAEVGERVRDAAGREGQRARPGGEELVAQLERELAVEDVERLVELVVVQRRAVPARPAAVLSITEIAPPVCSLRSATAVLKAEAMSVLLRTCGWRSGAGSSGRRSTTSSASAASGAATRKTAWTPSMTSARSACAMPRRVRRPARRTRRPARRRRRRRRARGRTRSSRSRRRARGARRCSGRPRSGPG